MLFFPGLWTKLWLISPCLVIGATQFSFLLLTLSLFWTAVLHSFVLSLLLFCLLFYLLGRICTASMEIQPGSFIQITSYIVYYIVPFCCKSIFLPICIVSWAEPSQLFSLHGMIYSRVKLTDTMELQSL